MYAVILDHPLGGYSGLIFGADGAPVASLACGKSYRQVARAAARIIKRATAS